MLETREILTKKMQDMQDVINYKIDTYEQKGESVTNALIEPWKRRI